MIVRTQIGENIGGGWGMTNFPLTRSALSFAVALPLVWLAFANAVTNATHRRVPTTALRYSPSDPVALNALADSRIAAAKGENANDPEIVAMARQSLSRSALNPVALRLIGTAASVGGGFKAGRAAMGAANRLSRRELMSQLWLIEDAVQRDDVAEALSHYDQALRIEPGSQQLLFPVLTAALEDRQLWAAFTPYVQRPTPWLGDFARHAIRTTKKPVELAEFFRSAGGLPRDPIFASLEGDLLKRLLAEGAFQSAKRYFISLPGANPAILATASFNEMTIDNRFIPFSWEIHSPEGMSSGFLRTEDGRAVELRSVLGTAMSGVIARKLVYVEPGDYRLRVAQRSSLPSEGASVRWELRCGRSANAIFSIDVALDEALTRRDARVRIPGGCDAAALRMIASAGIAMDGIEVIISSVELARLGS